MGDGKEQVTGQLTMDRHFLQTRKINLVGDSSNPDSLSAFGLDTPVSTDLDLLCIRYTKLKATDVPKVPHPGIKAIVELGSMDMTWVGHCTVTRIKDDNCGKLVLDVRLQSSGNKIPILLLDPQVSAQLPATVEWIPKTLLYR